MHRRLGFFALACFVAGIVSATSVARPTSTFTVRSTIDGMTVLPHHIHWLGRTNLKPSQIKEVDFLIDGRLAWVEHQAPYVYGSDENGRREGYLVTSWLSPGTHRFAVRAKARDGSTATDTVVARVLPAPAPPAALAGTWARTVDVSGAPKPGSPGNPTSTIIAPGRWTITFEKRWVHDQAPGKFVFPKSNDDGTGFVFLDDYSATPTRINVTGEVIMHQFSDKLAEGGWWCWPSGPPAAYSWSIDGDTLTLTPIGGHDACTVRGVVWSGQWTRVK